jgi:hypothetical protein
MKAITTTGLAMGGIAALFSPELLHKLSGREVFYILLVALALSSMGDSLLPAIKERLLPPKKQEEEDNGGA